MHVRIVTPAKPGSLSGNRATAERWAGLLRESGHTAEVVASDDPNAAADGADAAIALHAWRSAEAIVTLRARFPDRPLIVAMTGTDIYKFQHTEPETTGASMDAADVLIGLHAAVAEDLPERHRDKLHPVYQSTKPVPASYRERVDNPREIRVCVVGHLRAEKDPLRTAYAAARLPEDVRLTVHHAGRAHDESWAEEARAEMDQNPRYTWHGELPHGRVRKLMARSHAMVISSVMEGGANVVSEACAVGLPVLASKIPGNRGLLGNDYPALYPPEDTDALRDLLARLARDRQFRSALRQCSEALAPMFEPESERRRLTAALDAAAGG
jgi:putative glycosyltransferase (TIGR04348 family)